MVKEELVGRAPRGKRVISGKAGGDSAKVSGCRRTAEQFIRKPEGMYRSLVENIPAIVYIVAVDSVATPLFVGPQVRRLLGFSPDEFYAKPDLWLQQIHPDDRQRVIDGISASVAGLTTFAMEYRVLAKDGRVIWFKDRAEVLRCKKGRPQCFHGIALDITELKDAEERHRQLGGHLLLVREEEKKRIAREIHDELGQVMTALKTELELVEEGLLRDYRARPPELKSMKKLIQGALKTVKTISSELRPTALDALGLGAAVEWEAGEFQKRTGIRCEVFLEPREMDLDPRVATEVFRLIQEALTNVARHAKAKRVKVTLKKRGHDLLVEVSDNGKGITEEEASGKKSFGLLGMRERIDFLGGRMGIRGLRGKGTTLCVAIPLTRTGSSKE